MFTQYLETFTDVGFRTCIIYLLMIAGIVLAGKKELSQLSIADLVFILLISNAVQNAMVGENTSLAGGIMAGATLFVLNYIIKRLMFRYKGFHKLVSGEPVLLIKEGRLIKSNCDKQRITEDELLTAVHEHGLEKFSDVDMAFLEIDGNISVISYGTHKKTKYIRKSKKIVLNREY